MKFLVLGATGMAGHTIYYYLKSKGHDIVGLDLRSGNDNLIMQFDVTNKEALKEVIKNGKYDAVVNAIGVLNQFAEKRKDLAVFLNAYLPHYLAEITASDDTMIIHMSTDCVFSGKKGSYSEDDFRDGETFYDRSKALGELNDSKNITLRNSIIGPDINSEGIGLFNWFMKQGGPIRGYTKALWTGLTTLELAKAMEAAAKDKVTGLYNMVYSFPISKYDLLQLFKKYFKGVDFIIEPYDDFVCDKSLVRNNFDFNYTIPDYDTMIAEMAEWIITHKSLYPHYNL